MANHVKQNLCAKLFTLLALFLLTSYQSPPARACAHRHTHTPFAWVETQVPKTCGSKKSDANYLKWSCLRLHHRSQSKQPHVLCSVVQVSVGCMKWWGKRQESHWVLQASQANRKMWVSGSVRDATSRDEKGQNRTPDLLVLFPVGVINCSDESHGGKKVYFRSQFQVMPIIAGSHSGRVERAGYVHNLEQKSEEGMYGSILPIFSKTKEQRHLHSTWVFLGKTPE